MGNFLRADFYKLLRNRNILGAAVLMLGASAFMHYLIAIDWWQINMPPFHELGIDPLKGVSVFAVPFIMNLFAAFLASFMIANEFKSHGTIKNQVLSGIKRPYIIIAKTFTLALIMILVITLIPLLAGAIVGSSIGSLSFTPASIEALAQAYGLFMLNLTAYASILIFIAMHTGDTGKTALYSIGLTIAVFIFERLGGEGGLLDFIYQQTIFANFDQVFSLSLTAGELIHNIVIAALTIVVMTIINMYCFNRKEVN